MPVVDLIQSKPSIRIVVWHLVETTEVLLSSLPLTAEEQARFSSLSTKKGREYLGVRACLFALGVSASLLYDEKGKPFLFDRSHYVSVSHSHGMISVALSAKEIGIDIEKQRAVKIQNIRRKFVSESEEAWLSKKADDKQIAYLHFLWGIKEGLYKINGGTLWNFLHHYRVEEFDVEKAEVVSCTIVEGKTCKSYQAKIKKIEAYYFVWVV